MNIKKSILFSYKKYKFWGPKNKKKGILENFCPSANSSIQTTGHLVTRFAPNTYFLGQHKYTTKIILKTNFILQTFSSSIQISNIVLVVNFKI